MLSMARGGSDKEDEATDLTLCVNGAGEGRGGGGFHQDSQAAATAAVISDVAFVNGNGCATCRTSGPWRPLVFPLDALAVLGQSSAWLPGGF